MCLLTPPSSRGGGCSEFAYCGNSELRCYFGIPCHVSWLHASTRVFTTSSGNILMGIALLPTSMDHPVVSIISKIMFYACCDSAGGRHLSLYCLCLHDKPVQRRQSQHRSAPRSRHHQRLYCALLVLRLLQSQRWSNQWEHMRQLTGSHEEAKRNRVIPWQL